MTDTCAYCGLGIVPVPESVTGFRHAYQETDGHDAGPDIDPEYPPTAADLDPAVARLTREREAALEALRGLLAAAVFLDGSAFRCGICGRQGGDNHDEDFVCASAESTIHAIETGAIHEGR